ncbi:MAG TPA: hypothetical protein VHU82_15235 [Vicinamibacterales bacterium]|jgi:hypothetical protein|nr:hypothetical protein [Vicinamibacterales bacterium]
MKRVLLLAFVAAVVLPFAARAQAKADFSGTWTLDAAKSDAPGGRGGRGPQGPVTIAQTAADIKIGGATYKLDGSESVNEMAGRGGTTEAKSKAHWDGAKLVIETERQMGGNAVTITETRSLSADGKEMTVETSFNGNARKAVYTKG